MFCVVCMIQQAQPMACSDTHTHKHIHTQMHTLTHTVYHTCICVHRLTLMQYTVQSVSRSAWRSLNSTKTALPQTHSCTHTLTHTFTHCVMLENSSFQSLAPLAFCSICGILTPLSSSPILSSPDFPTSLPPSDTVHPPKASWHGDADGTAVARRWSERPEVASSRWGEGDPWMGCFRWHSSPAWEQRG